jgi:CRISPR/Cas system-associated exonuclease Cas4 (RecB family)
MKEIRLSPSTLNLFLECPRCFWLHINERIHRPRGIFPSLPGGMDSVIKVYFDKYRIKGELPPEIKGKVEGRLMPDLGLLNKWRNWRTGLEYKDEALGVTLFGALDDALQDSSTSSEQVYYMPLDYKTRGFPPREGDSEKYYGNQLDSYALMLEANNYSIKDVGYLVYYYPEKVEENGVVTFNIKVIELKTDPKRATKVLKDAMKLLSGPIPPHHSECEYCLWGRNNGD